MVECTLPYELHGTGKSKNAIFTFGSYVNLNRTAPSYAFMKTCIEMQAKYKMDCDIYYFVAKSNDWYCSGVSGLGDNFHSSVSALGELRDRYEKTIYIGNSMGGYAALAFGFLTAADKIIAFSAQTRLDKDFQSHIGETRWREAISNVQQAYDCEAYALDTIIRQQSGSNTQAQLYVGADCAQDMAYADILRFSSRVKVTEIVGEGHDLVHSLRETGTLVSILRDSVFE